MTDPFSKSVSAWRRRAPVTPARRRCPAYRPQPGPGKTALSRALPRPLNGPGAVSIYVLDRGRDGDPLDVLDRLSPGTWVILRDYDRLDRAAWARTVAARCRRRRLVLLVAGDARLALRVGAAGVHLPQGLARLGGVARLPLLISAAAHDAAAIRRAMRIGADAVLVSPVFATRSHPGAPGLGPHRLARLLARHRGARGVALVALGGISAATVRRLPPGVDGIAAIDGWSA
ncbi:hypothetical protein CKO24_00490 [Rhodothalassium salexigens DSM 2132]|nr:thiamine phosphate synthase [Rhodothalassium salexigens]MBK1637535.1 hypothetical protein [Rhodothalassium salexigens DSM 2132]